LSGALLDSQSDGVLAWSWLPLRPVFHDVMCGADVPALPQERLKQ
jgi:hypothetical protein